MPETKPSLVRPRPPVPRDPEIVDKVLARVAVGDPLAVVLREPGMPHYTAWYDWCREDAALGIAYARARATGFDQIAINARETARGRGESTQDTQRDKLIIETDLKLLAKWDPKRYGDKVVMTGDADNPIIVQTEGTELASELLTLLRGRRKQLQLEGKASSPAPAAPAAKGKP